MSKIPALEILHRSKVDGGVYYGFTVHGVTHVNHVLNDGSSVIHYNFKASANPFSSPFISWENLDHRQVFYSPYLLTAVQQKKKLCANIFFSYEDEHSNYVEGLKANKDVLFDNFERFDLGDSKLLGVNVVLKGALANYFDLQAVRNYYAELGVKNEWVKWSKVFQFCKVPLIELVKHNYDFDFNDARNAEDLIITGLLLGYPLETTASLLLN